MPSLPRCGLANSDWSLTSRRTLADRRSVGGGKSPRLVDRRIRAEHRAKGAVAGDQADGDASLLRLVQAEFDRVQRSCARGFRDRAI
jgi:hypothetical protein